MSIYLAKKELRNILDKSKLKYSLDLNLDRYVAVDKKGKYLSYDEYSEESLQNLVESRKNIYVDLEFWNYNYCTANNLDPSVSEEFIDNILYEKDLFITPGTIFGSNGEGYIRFSLCITEEKIKEAISRFE